MQNSPRSFQKFKKGPLVFSILFLTFSCAAFVFLYSQINNNKKTSADLQEQWQTEASRRNQVESLSRLVQSIQTERTELESHFAQSSDVVPFLDTVEQLATQASAKSEVESVDIAPDKSGLVLDVRATGSFQALYKFLTLLENSPYELDFNSVDMEHESGVDNWSAEFNLKLLSFIQ